MRSHYFVISLVLSYAEIVAGTEYYEEATQAASEVLA